MNRTDFLQKWKTKHLEVVTHAAMGAEPHINVWEGKNN